MPPDAAPPARSGLVVALDGPASSGKSSVGAAAAARLGYRFCDTGLLYRAVTWLALHRTVDETDAAALVRLVDEIELVPDEVGRLAHVSIDGVDRTAEVHTPEVDAAVSGVSRVPELRAALLQRQRRLAAQGRIVMAGRDIGTVVLPDADLKLFLDASVEERARRRAEERAIDPGSPEGLEILDQLRRRDTMDSSRPVAPLKAADDAVRLRTDGNGFDQTVELVVAAIREREAASGPATDPAATNPAATNPAATNPAATPPATAEAATAPKTPRERPRRRRTPVGPTPIASRNNLVITVGSFVMRFLVGLFTRVRIEGDLGSLPRTGALLVAANHASNVDPILIGAYLNRSLGRPFNWMGKRELFDWPVISWLARHGGVHPVERGAADVEAFRTATRILEEGQMLAVFPEGTRSPDGKLGIGLDGVTALAQRSKALIVPIGIGDSDRLWPKGRFLPKPTPSVTVRVGTPFRLDEALAVADPEAAVDRRRAKEAGTELIMRRIAELLPERQQGRYAGPS